MIVRSGTSPLTIGPPIDSGAEHTRINVDDDAIILDAHATEGPIAIRHVRNDGKNLITATDTVTGTVSMRVDSTGNVHQ